METGKAISVRNISKTFRVGEFEDKADSLVGGIAQALKKPLANYRKYRGLYKFDDVGSEEERGDILRALRDVSFEVNAGEVLGIVGMNGAGKSTLLKILSNITPPSGGRIEIHGRVTSLLEVGTGFHPELTGRENVFVNGTMLGMSKQEVESKFDEIVEFSGVERFLDTPVKRYSSGMAVRLAFAVAAHLEPEILIVDEVLAVGDAAFQRKCLDKMEGVSKEGRTILFVSHNMPAITRLCTRAILLKEGRVIMDDTPNAVVGYYLAQERNLSGVMEWEPDARMGDSVAKLNKLRVIDAERHSTELVEVQQKIGIEMEFEVFTSDRQLMPSIDLYDDQGSLVFVSVETDEAWNSLPVPAGKYQIQVWIPANLLNEGMYFVGCHIATTNPWEQHYNAQQQVCFQVVDNMEPGSARGPFMGNFPGAVRPKLNWQREKLA